MYILEIPSLVVSGRVFRNYGVRCFYLWMYHPTVVLFWGDGLPGTGVGLAGTDRTKGKSVTRQRV